VVPRSFHFWPVGPFASLVNRSSLGETAGHDLRRSALLFELYTEPVLHSEDNMFPRDPMGLQRGYNEDIQPWHAMAIYQFMKQWSKTNGLWMMMRPSFGTNPVGFPGRGSDGCHVDKTQAVGLFDNLRTVFLFVRCDPRDMNCNPTFVSPVRISTTEWEALCPVSRAFPGLN